MADQKGAIARIAVVVPGILGSTLAYDDGEEIWSDNFYRNYASLVSNPDLLRWNGRRATFTTFIDRAHFSNLPVPALNLWGATFQYLDEHFEHRLLYPYDWRDSLLRSADQFCQVLSEAFSVPLALSEARPQNGPKLVFFTHSMGGLLVRIAVGLGKLEASWIDSIIHIGSPLLGSPAAFRAAYDGNGLPHLNQLIGLRKWKDAASYRDVLRESFQSFPSLYQLFPRGEVPILRYGPYGKQSNPLNEAIVSEQHRQEAFEAHDALREANRVFAINRTRVGLIFTSSMRAPRTECEYDVEAVIGATARYQVRDVYGTSKDGDGTVLSYSARASEGDVSYGEVLDVEHAYMCNDARVVAFFGGMT